MALHTVIAAGDLREGDLLHAGGTNYVLVAGPGSRAARSVSPSTTAARPVPSRHFVTPLVSKCACRCAGCPRTA